MFQAAVDVKVCSKPAYASTNVHGSFKQCRLNSNTHMKPCTNTCGEYANLRPLTKVAVIRYVALFCGWDCRVDLSTPRHVGKYAEQIPKLGGRQCRVLILKKDNLVS